MPEDGRRVEELLARAGTAIARNDLASLGRALDEPRGWHDRQRSYEAVRRLVELVVASGPSVSAGRRRALAAVAADAVLAVLERTPAEPVLLNGAGVLLYELGEIEGAVSLFDAALRLDPDLPGAAENRALIGLVHGAPGRIRLELPELRARDRARRAAAAARPTEGLTLSLCMIVRDEEELLPRCLETAAGAVDEIVVVDTGSTDRTVAIAESCGARVFRVPWRGSFAEARNASLDLAVGDWILYLDADEHLQPGSAPALRALLGRTWREGFTLAETSYTGAEGAGLAVVHPALRLFRHRAEYRFEGRIHEDPTGRMPTYLPERFEPTGIRVHHYGYLKRRVAAKAKSRRNLALLAGEPPGPVTSYSLGREHQMLGDWPEAARHFEAAWDGLRRRQNWQADGHAPLLAVYTARALRECGRLADARAVLLEALAALPDYTDLTFELALCARAGGERRKAERLLARCLELGDSPPRYAATVGTGSHLARALLGELAEERGDAEAAEELYRAALAECPGYSAPARPLAALLRRGGRPPLRRRAKSGSPPADYPATRT